MESISNSRIGESTQQLRTIILDLHLIITGRDEHTAVAFTVLRTTFAPLKSGRAHVVHVVDFPFVSASYHNLVLIIIITNSSTTATSKQH